MTDVARFYHDVIDDVINGVKDEFVEEGLDLQVLDELKKLWTTKLAETHVFDPEPPVNAAAQYLNLLQRSQVQVRPVQLSGTNVNIPVRQVAPAGRVVIPSMNAELARTVGLSGSISAIRPAVMTGPSSQVPQATTGAHPQRLPQHAIVQGGLVATAGTAPTAQMHARGLVPGGTPQLAALPSGLTGHLVQIGQQTYLVPQTLVGLRQPVAHSQMSIPHLVSTTSGQNLITDPSTFQQTQVDGNHDNDDKSCDTPDSRRLPHGTARGSLTRPGLTERSATHGSDFDEEDDDDDDDDDFVAATPGFAPPSVRSSHYQALHHHETGPLDSSHHQPDPQSLMSAPQTPMTPSSVLSRTSFVDTPGHRRPSAARRQESTPLSRKRRRRSSAGAAIDTDTDDYDDDEDDDDEAYGMREDLGTSTPVTPAGHGIEPDEDYDGTGRSPRSRDIKGPRPIPHSTARLRSPSASQLDYAAPESHEPSSGGDLEPPQGIDDEEEQEDEEPLNSGDDVSDEEPEVLFESDNVVVCQYDKIHRSRNRWRFHLKDGIMAIHGRDHVFQKAVGEAEW